MLYPDFNIAQDECELLRLKDVTAPYSSNNLGGHGSPNIAKSLISKAKVTIDFGKAGVYSVTKPFAAENDFVILASELSDSSLVFDPCSTCGSQNVGHIGAIPSGCASVTYEPMYQNDNDEWVVAGKRTKKFIFKCVETYAIADLAKRVLKAKLDCQHSASKTEGEIDRDMASVYYLQSELDLLEGDLPCDCVAKDLANINARISELRKRW